MLVYQRVNCFAPDRFDQWCQRKCSKSSSSTPGGSCFSDCPALVQIGCALFNNEKVRDHPNISQRWNTPKVEGWMSKTLQIPLPWQVRKTTFWDHYHSFDPQLGRHQGAISA
jgi:hypothetical protein